MKKSTPRDRILKFLKTSDKKINLKSNQRKKEKSDLYKVV